MNLMRRAHLPGLLSMVLSVCLPSLLVAQPAPTQTPRAFDLVRLSEDAYAAIASPGSEAAANTAFVITEKWVCVFDSHLTAEAAKALLDEIRKITSLPVRYLVNSHYHGDHTHGNQALPNDVEVISTHNTWQNLLNKDLPQLQRYQQILPDQIARARKELTAAGSTSRAEELRLDLQQREQVLSRIQNLELVLPGLTFDHALSLRTLHKEIQLLSPGRGHTDGDAILWLADEKILFAGDLVLNHALPNLSDGYSKEWIETLAVIAKLKPELIVPGHGAVGDDSLIAAQRDYLQEVRKMVKSAMEKNQTLDEILKTLAVPQRFKDYEFQHFFPANIEKIYREYLEEAATQKQPGA